MVYWRCTKHAFLVLCLLYKFIIVDSILLRLLLVEDSIQNLLLLCRLHRKSLSSATLEHGKDPVDSVLNRVIEHDRQCRYNHKTESSRSPLFQRDVGAVLEKLSCLVNNCVNSDSRLK